MSGLISLSQGELEQKQRELMSMYSKICAQGLTIDITRGKPASDQLDLANSMLTLPGEHYYSAAGVDCRNYGQARGLPELIDIFAPLLPAPAANTMALGNSSLEIMHSLFIASLLQPPVGAQAVWDSNIKFLCPVPGYDRHFAITESLSITMIPVPMREDGPDMNMVEELTANDPAIKGIWLVPIYANPTGVTISVENTLRLAAIKTAAPDFRIFWDNAYAVHTFEGKPPVRDIFHACVAAGNPDRVYMFASTSKITFAGSGVSFFASSAANMEWYLKYRECFSIGPDKLNQLRHVHYLQSPEHVHEIMIQQATLIKPKFQRTLEILEEKLSSSKVAHWSQPEGGYFINLDVLDGTARRVVELAMQAGVKLTQAGSTFPYGVDPRDENIRLAPTFVTNHELEKGMEAVAYCVLLAAVEKLLEAFSDPATSASSVKAVST